MIAVAGGILIVLLILAVAFLGLMMIGNDGAGPGFTFLILAIAAAVWVIL